MAGERGDKTMSKMTSALANKMIRKLNEDKEFWLQKEREASTFVASVDEEPVIPEYDYSEVAAKIAEIDAEVTTIRHAINVNNCANLVQVGDAEMTVDTILVKMAQLNARKNILDRMRKQLPKTRLNTATYSSRKSAPEYQYVNYDIEQVKKDYDRIDGEISAMQIALDKYNQTFEFEVNI